MVSAFRYLEAVKATAPAEPAAFRARLQDASDRMSTAIEEVRAVLNDLIPPGLDELGLARALKTRVATLAGETGIDAAVTGMLPRLEATAEQALYGMTLEAVTNAVRHGEATRITVELRTIRGRAVIEITDNGVGFDPVAAGRARRADGGLGLLGIVRQATWLGGSTSVRSRPGAGARIRISVPIDHTVRARVAAWSSAIPHVTQKADTSEAAAPAASSSTQPSDPVARSAITARRFPPDDPHRRRSDPDLSRRRPRARPPRSRGDPLHGSFARGCRRRRRLHIGDRRDRRSKPDIVLMDIRMPGIDGLACLEQVKLLMPQVSVVIVTLYDDRGYLVEALRLGAAGYLLKDASGSEVLETIRRVVAGQLAVNPELLRAALSARPEELAGAPRQQPAPEAFALTPRERDVLELVAEGMTNKEIGQQLGIAEDTVKKHVQNLIWKLRAADRTQAAIMFESADTAAAVHHRNLPGPQPCPRGTDCRPAR